MININTARALVISEIMYDPAGSDTGREWVEVYNDDNNSIDIADYKLNEYKATTPADATNHSITAGETLLSHEYAVIASDINKFRIDYPSFTGKVYKASFTLLNSEGQNISIRYKPSGANDYNILSEIDTTNYIGIESGHSICNSKVEQLAIEWADCSATPGATNNMLNVLSGAPATTTNNQTASTTTSTTTTSNNTGAAYTVPIGISYYVPNTNLYIKVGDMNIESIKEKDVIAGAEFTLIVKAFNIRGEAIKNLKYYWSMGDGGYYEGDTLKYKYHLPGTYDYTIEAGDDRSYAQYKGVIKVHEPRISISAVGTSSNYINVKNGMNIDLDIGGFIIKDNKNNKSFKLPRNVLLRSDRELKLSGDAMGFVSTSSDNYSLIDSSGRSLYEYRYMTVTATSPHVSTTSNVINSTMRKSYSMNTTDINKKYVNREYSPLITRINDNSNVMYRHSLARRL